MPDPSVQERVIGNVISTLAAIAPGSLYYTKVERVYEMVGNGLDKVELPCALVLFEGQEEKYGAIDMVSVEMKLAISLSMSKDVDGAWQTKIRQFAEDAKRALRIDYQRGQFNGSANAGETNIDATTIANEQDGFKVALAQVDVRIQYRHQLDDPTIAA